MEAYRKAFWIMFAAWAIAICAWASAVRGADPLDFDMIGPPAPPRAATYRPAPRVTAPRPIVRSGSHWTHPGRIDQHLIGTHRVAPGNLPSTKEGQLSLHDRLHEEELAMQRMRQVPRVLRAPATPYCPSGNCPWSR